MRLDLKQSIASRISRSVPGNHVVRLTYFSNRISIQMSYMCFCLCVFQCFSDNSSKTSTHRQGTRSSRCDASSSWPMSCTYSERSVYMRLDNFITAFTCWSRYHALLELHVGIDSVFKSEILKVASFLFLFLINRYH